MIEAPRSRIAVATLHRMTRAAGRNGETGPDRFETERAEFFERVRHAYLERAARAPARFRVVDATGPVEAVEQAVRLALAPLLHVAEARP